MSTPNESAWNKPPIHMSEADYERIADMALRNERIHPVASKLLLEEIDRATLYPVEKLPEDAVALGSEVEFMDNSNGVRRRVKLVFPEQADAEAGRISIMTPVGAGLIGMREGQEISWPRRDGSVRTLKVLDVRQRS